MTIEPREAQFKTTFLQNRLTDVAPSGDNDFMNIPERFYGDLGKVKNTDRLGLRLRKRDGLLKRDG